MPGLRAVNSEHVNIVCVTVPKYFDYNGKLYRGEELATSDNYYAMHCTTFC